MKLIAKFDSVAEADAVAMQLRSVGIVTHVSHRGTKSLGHIMHSLADSGLWVVLEHQHEDALSFVNDYNHTVTTGLSDDEFREFQENAGKEIFNSLNKAIIYGVGIIFVMLLIVNHLYVPK